MMIDDPVVWRAVRGIVQRLTADAALHEDLMQEALAQLWHLEEERPGQRQCWYLQGCRFYLQNLLRAGRSMDATKHRWAQMFAAISEDSSEAGSPQANEGLLEAISARDLISVLSEWLTPKEKDALLCLADGLSAREIAKRLNISHTLVNRHRRRIAAVALKLGIGLPEKDGSRVTADPEPKHLPF